MIFGHKTKIPSHPSIQSTQNPFALPIAVVGLAPNPLLNAGLWAIALGMIMGFTLAPLSFWGLAWVGLAPLWMGIVRANSLQKAAFLGGCWGLGYQGVALSWLWGLHPLTWMGMSWSTSWMIVLLCWLAVTLWGAGVSTLWALGLRTVSPFLPSGSRIVLGATLWCVLEWLWSQSPLWWTALANTQSPHNWAILHLGQLSGPDTLTLVLLLTNGAIAEAWFSRRRQWFGMAVGFCLACHGLGWGLAHLPLDAAPNQPLSVGIIQGNIPSRFKLFPAGIQQSVTTYRQAYRELAPQKVDAVLLPEGALPFFWGQFPAYEGLIKTDLRELGVPLWAGTFMPTGQRYTQSLVNLQDKGVVLSQYNKVKLVPLGESLPFGPWLEGLLHRLSPVQLGMVAGSFHQSFQTPFGPAIVGICYDSVFSELFRSQAAAGGQFILSVANNDPFGARMMAQHHALDTLRAIETDRWLVRATNTGISAVIDPHGHTHWRSPINQKATHVAVIERRQTQTLYVRVGNWLLPVMLLLSTGLGWRHNPFRMKG